MQVLLWSRSKELTLAYDKDGGESQIQCQLDTGPPITPYVKSSRVEAQPCKKSCRMLQREREVNLKLNPKKLKLRLNEVPYIGYLLTPDGVKPDPEKVRTVQDMPRPDGRSRAEKVKAVQRFLGFVNYLIRATSRRQE